MPSQVMKVRMRVEGAVQADAAQRLTQALQSDPGVVRIRLEAAPPAAAPTTTRLLTVSYRPEATSPRQLLTLVQAAGFTQAHLV